MYNLYSQSTTVPPSSVVKSSQRSHMVARAKIFIRPTVFLTFYSLVFIVICELFSLTFILIITSTRLC